VPATDVATREERVALARAALASAERRTGARSVVHGRAAGAGTVEALTPGVAVGSSVPQETAGEAGGSATGGRGTGRGGVVVGAPGPGAGASVRVTSPGSGAPATGLQGALEPDVRTWTPHQPAVAERVTSMHPAEPHRVPGPGTSGRETTVPVARRTSLLTSERPALPVPAALEPLLPDGLRRGGTFTVLGSTSLLLTMLAAACSGGAWAALVGHPTVGLLAAAQAGVVLDRLAVVPAPGLETPTVVAALLDGVDVVLVGPAAALTDADRRRLTARARERGAVLLTSVPWPGAGVVLTAEQGRWDGVGAGDGRLRTHELRVARSGRGASGARQVVDLALPLGTGIGVVVEPSGVTGADGHGPAPRRAPLRLVG
jgi:hypothetical protein